jgi:hypothetical protein
VPSAVYLHPLLDPFLKISCVLTVSSAVHPHPLLDQFQASSILTRYSILYLQLQALSVLTSLLELLHPFLIISKQNGSHFMCT